MSEGTRLLVASLAVVGLTLGGGLLPLVREWDRRAIRLLLAFGTGVLLGAAFFHMIPEAAPALGGSLGAAVLAGFLLIYVVERFVMVHPCEEHGCDFHRMGLAAFAGITLHSLIDGFALGAGLSIPQLSTAVTLAIVLHKLPASLSLTGILLHCEYPRRRIVWLLVLFSCSTPVGAVLSLGVLSELEGIALHYAVAFSAGTFLAIATADLLPQVHSAPDGRYRNLVALFAGILVMTIGSAIAHPDHDQSPAAGDAHGHSSHEVHGKPAG